MCHRINVDWYVNYFYAIACIFNGFTGVNNILWREKNSKGEKVHYISIKCNVHICPHTMDIRTHIKHEHRMPGKRNTIRNVSVQVRKPRHVGVPTQTSSYDVL